jgi:hypothetical protein
MGMGGFLQSHISAKDGGCAGPIIYSLEKRQGSTGSIDLLLVRSGDMHKFKTVPITFTAANGSLQLYVGGRIRRLEV